MRVGSKKIQHIPAKQTKKNFKISNEFSKILDEAIEDRQGLKISKHAENRIMERDLSFGKKDLKKLEKSVNLLAEKGSRESLILYKDMALVTSIENRTIITALDRDEMELITNIDSAMIVR